MTELIFATHSDHKVKEIMAMLPQQFTVKSLKDIAWMEEIIEDGKTLEDNALIKVRTIHQHLGKNCFAEDTGLEVDALGGEPGVHTARYAGEHRDTEDNIVLLLNKLENKTDRRAQFRTVMSLILDQKEFLFEGIVRGHIAEKKSGESGFGYDPIFIPEGYDQSFAQLGSEIKNRISHRAQALQKMLAFLNSIE